MRGHVPYGLTNPAALKRCAAPLANGPEPPFILSDMLPPEITPQDLVQLQQQPNPPVLLDVREKWEYDTAHLPNSVLIPMGEIPSRAYNELDPDQPVIVMCHHGARSLNVTMWLRQQGYDHAQSLAGGIDAWSRSIDPNVPRY
jgi:rhodanese-related sulfurtransferase